MPVKKKVLKKRKPRTPKAEKNALKYQEKFDDQAFSLCLLGAVDQDLADFFEVDVATIHRWKEAHPSFCDALTRAKKPSDAAVAGRLYERAMGFEWTEEIAMKVKEKRYADNGKLISEIERVEVVSIKRKVPPDTPAAIFWLKNRQKNAWRDKPPEPPAPPDANKKGPVKITFKMDREIKAEEDAAGVK